LLIINEYISGVQKNSFKRFVNTCTLTIVEEEKKITEIGAGLSEVVGLYDSSIV
jgi:hypothetical protein